MNKSGFQLWHHDKRGILLRLLSRGTEFADLKKKPGRHPSAILLLGKKILESILSSSGILVLIWLAAFSCYRGTKSVMGFQGHAYVYVVVLLYILRSFRT
jgi:hypothetical protein